MIRILFFLIFISFYFVSCTVDPTYDCDGNGNCYDLETGDGQFISLADCQSACFVNANTTWDCNGNGNCFDPGNGSGEFTSLNNCLIICGVDPTSTWNCDGNGNCYDPGNGNGFYSNLDDCIYACSGPSWECDGMGQCFDPGDGSGQYSTLSSCQSNCVPPPPPNGPCNITSVTYGPYIILLGPSPNPSLGTNIYNFGDQVSITMYHPSYQWMQGGLELYKNETFISNLNYSSWSSSQSSFTLPSSGAGASNCYTVRATGVSGNPPYHIISDPLTIY